MIKYYQKDTFRKQNTYKIIDSLPKINIPHLKEQSTYCTSNNSNSSNTISTISTTIKKILGGKKNLKIFNSRNRSLLKNDSISISHFSSGSNNNLSKFSSLNPINSPKKQTIKTTHTSLNNNIGTKPINSIFFTPKKKQKQNIFRTSNTKSLIDLENIPMIFTKCNIYLFHNKLLKESMNSINNDQKNEIKIQKMIENNNLKKDLKIESKIIHNLKQKNNDQHLLKLMNNKLDNSIDLTDYFNLKRNEKEFNEEYSAIRGKNEEKEIIKRELFKLKMKHNLSDENNLFKYKKFENKEPVNFINSAVGQNLYRMNPLFEINKYGVYFSAVRDDAVMLKLEDDRKPKLKNVVNNKGELKKFKI